MEAQTLQQACQWRRAVGCRQGLHQLLGNPNHGLSPAGWMAQGELGCCQCRRLEPCPAGLPAKITQHFQGNLSPRHCPPSLFVAGHPQPSQEATSLFARRERHGARHISWRTPASLASSPQLCPEEPGVTVAAQGRKMPRDAGLPHRHIPARQNSLSPPVPGHLWHSLNMFLPFTWSCTALRVWPAVLEAVHMYSPWSWGLQYSTLRMK